MSKTSEGLQYQIDKLKQLTARLMEVVQNQGKLLLIQGDALDKCYTHLFPNEFPEKEENNQETKENHDQNIQSS